MKKKKTDSFSLLNQQEIDTLVRFLTMQKTILDSDVMSQGSIDKLISLITTDTDRIALDSALAYDDVNGLLLSKLGFCDDASSECELRFNIDSETNFVELIIYNKVSDKSFNLSPSVLEESDLDAWGFAISPVIFTHIAQNLNIGFTRDTYDAVCDTFAKVNFGDANHKIPAVMLPDNAGLIDCLL